MEKKMKALKSLSRFHDQKVSIMLIRCFFASMIFLALSKPYEQYAENVDTKRRPLCYIDQKGDICEMAGDIRVHGNSSTVTLLPSSQIPNSYRNESYRIRPYARRGDEGAMSQVFVQNDDKYTQCTINHTIPAIIFSVSGYAGNLFHDSTDITNPLFLTSQEFNGEVQFLGTNTNPWWIHKYKLVLSKLSKYQVIDFDKDNRVHCFKHVIVGLRCHKELSIDRLRTATLASHFPLTSMNPNSENSYSNKFSYFSFFSHFHESNA